MSPTSSRGRFITLYTILHREQLEFMMNPLLGPPVVENSRNELLRMCEDDVKSGMETFSYVVPTNSLRKCSREEMFATSNLTMAAESGNDKNTHFYEDVSSD